MKGRHRLLLALGAVTLIAAFLLVGGSAWLIRTAVEDRFVERIEAETALLAEWTGSLSPARTQEFAVQVSRRLGVRVSLITADGTVVGDSSRDRASLSRMDDHSTRPEILAAAVEGHGLSRRRSGTTNVEYLYSARLAEGEGPIRYVRLALPLAQVRRAQTGYAWTMALVALLSMAALLAMAYVAVRRLSRPLEQMADAVERTAGGELQLALPPGRTREVERLGVSVRRMQQALLGKLAELDAERNVLVSVISGMKEGLLLVGADRRVRLANQALRRIIDLDSAPEGHPLHEVVRQPAMVDAIETSLRGERDAVETVIHHPISDRSFEIRVTPLRAAETAEITGSLALLFDITRLETLEGVRREFVANVSHELRTPLTSIQAAVETLLDGGLDDRPDAERFLDIVRRNATHMATLVEDLTDLSLVETGAVSLEIRRIDAREAALDVVERLRPVATELDVRLVVELPAPFPVAADRRRLEQILTNLVDNGLKFNRRGGSVTVRADTARRKPTLVVEDTGVGIPSSCLDKVFHRFYQVGSERSGRGRGTGLGLALVKHLMRLQGGSVRAESELGQGSRFILEFPQRQTLELAG